jgi:hypothetical protein
MKDGYALNLAAARESMFSSEGKKAFDAGNYALAAKFYEQAMRASSGTDLHPNNADDTSVKLANDFKQAIAKQREAEALKRQAEQGSGTCAFGTTCNPSDPKLEVSKDRTQVVTHNATDQLKTAVNSDEAAIKKGISDEAAKAKSNCQFDVKGCDPYVSNPAINKAPGQPPGTVKLVTHIPGPARNDKVIQESIKYYEKLDGLKMDTQAKLAAIVQKIKNKEGDAKVLDVEQETLNINLKGYDTEQAKTQTQIKDRLIARNTPWIEDPPPPPVTGSEVKP